MEFSLHFYLLRQPYIQRECYIRLLKLKARDLSRDQIRWLIKIQDPDFYNHGGIDLQTPGAGLTTITQSIIKKLYFKKFKLGVKKFKQSLIAVFIVDKLLEKDKQLTIFINSVYMGNLQGKDLFSFNDAAKAYFDKEFSQLTDNEYLSLVAMLLGPDKFNTLTNAEENEKRVVRIKVVISGEYLPRELSDVYYHRI